MKPLTFRKNKLFSVLKKEIEYKRSIKIGTLLIIHVRHGELSSDCCKRCKHQMEYRLTFAFLLIYICRCK